LTPSVRPPSSWMEPRMPRHTPPPSNARALRHGLVIHRVNRWTMAAVTAERWAEGRVLLAGTQCLPYGRGPTSRWANCSQGASSTPVRNATGYRVFILPLIPNALGARSDIHKHYLSDCFFLSSRRGLDYIPRVASKGPVGDACHQMPPAGGFGMNSGIADAHPRGPGPTPKV